MNLTQDQLDALQKLQDTWPRKWRDMLRRCWMLHRYPFAEAPLSQLRNTLGPRWLQHYRAGDTRVGWLAPGTYYHGDQQVQGFVIHFDNATNMLKARSKTAARHLAREQGITLIEEFLP